MFWNFYQRFILDKPFQVILACVLINIFLVLQIDRVRIDASAGALTLEGDKTLAYSREISARYHAKDALLVTFSPKNGDLFSDSSLDTLSKLRGELAALEPVESVASMLDVPLLQSPPVGLSDISSGKFRTLRDPVDRDLVRREFQESPIYRSLLVSPDERTTILQMTLPRDYRYFELLNRRDDLRLKKREEGLNETEQSLLKKTERDFQEHVDADNDQRDAMVADIRKIITRYQDVADLYLGGVPMILTDMVDFVESDLQVFGIGIAVLIVLILAVIFRHPTWVFAPLLTCAMTIVAMLGVLALLDWRMSVVSSNFVTLLLILNLSILLHLIVRYREFQQLQPEASSQELIRATMRAMWRPCIYMTLTTMVAFISLLVSGIRPVIDFGWMMTLGLLCAYLMAFTFFPALLLKMPIGAVSHKQTDSPALTHYFAVMADRYRKSIAIGALILAALSVFGLTKLEVENRFIDYFAKDTAIYTGMELMDREFGGTIPFDVILVADPEEAVDEGMEEEDDFFDEEEGNVVSSWFTRSGLDVVSRAHNFLDSLDETGKVQSLAIAYDVARQLLGENISDIELAVMLRVLPKSARELLIDPYLSDPAREARITLRVKETSPNLRRGKLLAHVRSSLVDELGLRPDQVRLTGTLVLYQNMLQSLYRSQILTLGAVFVVVMIMFLILFNGGLRIAIAGILPTLLAAGTVLGGMGFWGLPLDIMTITIAAIVVGIGVDHTIHYLYRFRSEFTKDKDYMATMYRCHSSIGKAMYYTSISIICGFSILALSNFNPSIYFGLLTSMAMISALLGALLLLPHLIRWLKAFG